MRPAPFVISTLLLVLVTLPASAEEWEKTYPIHARAGLVLHTDDAAVEVDTWDRPSVGIRVTTRGWRIGGGGIQITDDTDGDRVALEIREPHHFASLRIGFDNRWTRIEVRVPRSADIDLTSGDGSLTIHPIRGNVRARTGDGSITVHGAHGTLSLHTADGSIRGDDLEGKLLAGTGDGSIQVSGKFLSLDLESGDGSITASAEPFEDRDDWRLVSGDGSVTIQLPGGFKADLDAQTGDGHISMDFPVEVSGTLRHSLIRGTMNGGGAPLHVKTGDGSIRIRQL